MTFHMLRHAGFKIAVRTNMHSFVVAAAVGGGCCCFGGAIITGDWWWRGGRRRELLGGWQVRCRWRLVQILVPFLKIVSSSIPQYTHQTNWLSNPRNHRTTTQNRDITKSSHAKRSSPSTSPIHSSPWSEIFIPFPSSKHQICRIPIDFQNQKFHKSILIFELKHILILNKFRRKFSHKRND